uniref:Ionotropic glutamate receptor C-terminal domain-containing protein n=1 Tax=Glossina brevipalpis TaxID=37001 RepID=A0A1A9WV32_9MUSC
MEGQKTIDVQEKVSNDSNNKAIVDMIYEDFSTTPSDSPITSHATYLLLILMASHFIMETKTQVFNSSLAIEISKSLHKAFKIRNFVFFLSEHLLNDMDIMADFFPKFWKNFPRTPYVMVTRMYSHMQGFLDTRSLIYVFTTGYDDPILNLAANNLKGIRYFRTILVFLPRGIHNKSIVLDAEEYVNFNDNLLNIFAWIWKKQFSRTLLLSVANNIYLQEPFPTPTIINKTDNWSIGDFFIRYTKNLRGRIIKTPICYDLPRVFRLPNNVPSGVSGKLFAAFMRSINASLIDDTTCYSIKTPYNLTKILQDVYEGHFEISIHSYTEMLHSPAGSSYPVGINDFCFIVPFRRHSPEHLFLQRTLQNSAWVLVVFGVFYVTLCILWLSPEEKRDFSLAFLQSISSFLYLPPPQTLNTRAKYTHILSILLFILGFCLTNLYQSKMSSYLTASLPDSQINTMADLLATDLKVMVMEHELPILKSAGFHSEFLKRLIPVKKDIMDFHRDHLNTTYGYSSQTDRWHFLNKQQVQLNYPLFHLSEICIGPYYLVFPIHEDSILHKSLRYFILYTAQYGLQVYWSRGAFADALALKYVNMMVVNEEIKPFLEPGKTSLHFET